MAMNQTPEHSGDDHLNRALLSARAAAANPPRGWFDLSAAIMAKVRGQVMPSKSLLVEAADGSSAESDGSRTWVAARVVTAAVRHTLRASSSHAPVAIELDIESIEGGDRLRGLEVDLVVEYGSELPALAERVRADLRSALAELGISVAEDRIEVAFVDVTLGDPRWQD